MNVLFNNKYVEELILDLVDVSINKKKIMKILPADDVHKIKKLYDILKAAPNFYFMTSFPLGHMEELKGDFSGKFSLRVNKNYRLIISPNAKDCSKIELSNCIEYYLEGVVDYHDGKRNWLIP